MSKKDFVMVRVLDIAGPGGGCACSSTPRGPKELLAAQQKCTELKQALEDAYPAQTGLEYVNLAESPDDRFTDPGQLLVNRTYPPPLIVIDGEPRFAGSIQVNKILTEVGKVLNT